MTGKPVRDEDEDLLMAKIGRADTVALELLYYRYRLRLHRFLLALGCPETELDEICNETFYVVWRRSKTFDGSCRLSTWIFGIARNKAMDLLRRERRRNMRQAESDVDDLPELQLSGADRFELRQWLEAALDLLPVEQRNVVELAFLDGLSYLEIAKILDCPESTVKTRMFHARRKLKHAFPRAAEVRSERNS